MDESKRAGLKPAPRILNSINLFLVYKKSQAESPGSDYIIMKRI